MFDRLDDLLIRYEEVMGSSRNREQRMISRDSAS